MYIHIQLRPRRARGHYRLAKGSTRRLRSRADYPHAQQAPAAAPTARTGPRRLRAAHGISARRAAALQLFAKRLGVLGACLALALLIGGGIAFARARRTANLCHETDMAPLSQMTAFETPAEEDAPRTVYLTFDDGPSENTRQVLQILREAGVRASFFVIAAENNQEHLPLLQQTLADGHCLGLHSRTHEYRHIYASAEAYWADIEALRQALVPYCGDYAFKVLRFPGGSSNTVSHKYGGDGLMEQLIAQAAQKGYTVVDWNVSAEDSVGGDPSANTIASRVIRGCRDKNSAVVLMHDSETNDATVEALPTIIQWLQENGYTFDTVDHLPQG